MFGCVHDERLHDELVRVPVSECEKINERVRWSDFVFDSRHLFSDGILVEREKVRQID